MAPLGRSDWDTVTLNPFLKQHSWDVCQKGKHESRLSGKVEFGNVFCSLPWDVLGGQECY